MTGPVSERGAGFLCWELRPFHAIISTSSARAFHCNRAESLFCAHASTVEHDMPLRREAHRLLTRMTQRIDERSALVREIRKANLDAEDESWKRIDDSRKLLA